MTIEDLLKHPIKLPEIHCQRCTHEGYANCPYVKILDKGSNYKITAITESGNKIEIKIICYSGF